MIVTVEKLLPVWPISGSATVGPDGFFLQGDLGRPGSTRCSTWVELLTLLVCCVLQRPDEEVVVDQGGTSSVLNIHYEKEELEGEGLLFVWFFWKCYLPLSPQYSSPELRFSQIIVC